MYYVYILRCSDGSLYTGITNNLKKRLDAHNKKRASKYTRSRVPVDYVFIKSVENKSQALKLEIKIKSLSRDKKIAYIKSLENEIDSLRENF
ncbi:MAG: GIY-YIG nuclease family protein [Finegoldia sp.]|nr:GIY-YIG nuclease family protein [Finegoldia sp.]